MRRDDKRSDTRPGRPPREPKRRQTRERGEVLGTPRSAPLSEWRTAKELAATERGVRAAAGLLDSATAQWVINYLIHIFQGRARFATYRSGRTGVFTMPNRITIGLAADWGTGTETAYAVGDAIAAEHPDITIHLGDVYYSGDLTEFNKYFLPRDCWPRGARPQGHPTQAAGTYILNGNHEMYSGGHAYFGVALPSFEQEASYFCLENDYWRVVGVDTGYDCTRGLQYVFGIDRTTIHREVLDWLRDVVFRDAGDRRPVVLLSHHQWFTAFDPPAYPRVGEALVPYLDRVLLWLWGHEHRFIGYAPFAPLGVPIRARCIGHGGMPIEVYARGDAHLDVTQNTSDWSRKPVFLDNRRVTTIGNTEVGHCGYAILRTVPPSEDHGPTLTITYFDDRRTTLLEERWEQTRTGLRGAVEQYIDDPDFIWFRRPDELVAG
jgi:hypothetical protein